MDPLEQLLRPLAAVINRQVRNKTPARALCRELDGRIVAIRVRDTALAMYFVVDADGLDLRLRCDDEPDVVISGSLWSLASLATQGGYPSLRNGSIELIGDVYTARAFQQLLGYGRPDLEEELSAVVGDAAAHGIGNVARGVGRWARDARRNMQQNVTEYLQEESRALPSRYEVEKFRQAVNTLRDDVDRLEARIRRLERPGS